MINICPEQPIFALNNRLSTGFGDVELIPNIFFYLKVGVVGWCDVLGNLPLPGRPSNLDYSRARAYCACNGCGGGCLDIFSLVYHLSLLSPSLSGRRPDID